MAKKGPGIWGPVESCGWMRNWKGELEIWGYPRSLDFQRPLPTLAEAPLRARSPDTCRWRYAEGTRPGDRQRGTGKPREPVRGSDPGSLRPAPASCFRRESDRVVGVSALALGVSAGLVGGGISPEKAAGWKARASRARRWAGPRGVHCEDWPASQGPGRFVVTPRRPQFEGTAK